MFALYLYISILCLFCSLQGLIQVSANGKENVGNNPTSIVPASKIWDKVNPIKTNPNSGEVDKKETLEQTPTSSQAPSTTDRNAVISSNKNNHQTNNGETKGPAQKILSPEPSTVDETTAIGGNENDKTRPNTGEDKRNKSKASSKKAPPLARSRAARSNGGDSNVQQPIPGNTDQEKIKIAKTSPKKDPPLSNRNKNTPGNDNGNTQQPNTANTAEEKIKKAKASPKKEPLSGNGSTTHTDESLNKKVEPSSKKLPSLANSNKTSPPNPSNANKKLSKKVEPSSTMLPRKSNNTEVIPTPTLNSSGTETITPNATSNGKSLRKRGSPNEIQPDFDRHGRTGSNRRNRTTQIPDTSTNTSETGPMIPDKDSKVKSSKLLKHKNGTLSPDEPDFNRATRKTNKSKGNTSVRSRPLPRTTMPVNITTSETPATSRPSTDPLSTVKPRNSTTQTFKPISTPEKSESTNPPASTKLKKPKIPTSNSTTIPEGSSLPTSIPTSKRTSAPAERNNRSTTEPTNTAARTLNPPIKPETTSSTPMPTAGTPLPTRSTANPIKIPRPSNTPTIEKPGTRSGKKKIDVLSPRPVSPSGTKEIGGKRVNPSTITKPLTKFKTDMPMASLQPPLIPKSKRAKKRVRKIRKTVKLKTRPPLKTSPSPPITDPIKKIDIPTLIPRSKSAKKRVRKIRKTIKLKTKAPLITSPSPPITDPIIKIDIPTPVPDISKRLTSFKVKKPPLNPGQPDKGKSGTHGKQTPEIPVETLAPEDRDKVEVISIKSSKSTSTSQLGQVFFNLAVSCCAIIIGFFTFHRHFQQQLKEIEERAMMILKSNEQSRHIHYSNMNEVGVGFDLRPTDLGESFYSNTNSLSRVSADSYASSFSRVSGNSYATSIGMSFSSPMSTQSFREQSCRNNINSRRRETTLEDIAE